MLNILDSNKTTLQLRDYLILFSYNTPVACYYKGQFFKTTKKWSATTSRHINSWVYNASGKPQEFFDNLIKHGE